MERRRLVSLAAAVTLAALWSAACQSTEGRRPPDRSGEAAAPATPNLDDYRAELRLWASERETSLRSETGYLALAGLYWLEEGESTFGSAEDNDVVFPAGRAPDHVGVLRLADGVVSVQARPGSGLLHEDEPVDSLTLASDADGAATRLTVGELTFWVVDRGGRMGIRLRDPRSPVLAAYSGTERYPVNVGWRVEGRFEAFDGPRTVDVPTILGTSYADDCPGTVTFDVDGRTHRVEPTGSVDAGLFLIFADATNGEHTYGGGRFLRLGTPDDDGRVVVDFNKAYNPPCAYSPYTTCPLPPEANRLSIPIEAGEKTPKS